MTRVISTTFDNDVINFDIAGAGIIQLDVTRISAANMKHAAIYGLIQRVSDKAAIARNTATGASASPEAKLAALAAMITHLESGADTWNLRVAGDGGGLRGGVTLQALANVYAADLATMRERVNAAAEKRGIKSAVYLREVAASPKVAAEIVRLKSAMGNADLADSLMDELGE